MQAKSKLRKRHELIRQKNGSTVSLFLCDCIRGMQDNLLPGSVDVVVTSPPYNIGVKYGKHQDNLPRSDYLGWMKDLGRSVKKVLDDDGSFFLNLGNTPRDQWIAWDVAQILRKEFVLQNVIHWVKSIAISKADVGDYPGIASDVAVGHFKPIVSNRYLNDCQEYIFHFTKTGDVKLDKLAVGVPYQDKTNIGRWRAARQDLRDRGNTWFIPYETIKNKSERPHPAVFPVKLPEMCLKLHGVSSDTLVLDPFLGIGSTAEASMRLGSSFVGFEIDPAYFEEAFRRLSRRKNE